MRPEKAPMRTYLATTVVSVNLIHLPTQRWASRVAVGWVAESVGAAQPAMLLVHLHECHACVVVIIVGVIRDCHYDCPHAYTQPQTLTPCCSNEFHQDDQDRRTVHSRFSRPQCASELA